MRLYSFRIKGFRSIIDTGECIISENDNIVILAGQNEAGKSAVLEALDFFRNGPNEKFLKFQKRSLCNISEVICKYILEENDFLFFSNEVENYEQFEKYFRKNRLISFIRRSIKDKVEDIKIEDESIEIIKEFSSKIENKTSDANTPEQIQENGSSQNLTPISITTEEITKKIIDELLEMIPPFSMYSTFTDLLPSDVEVIKLSESKAIYDFENVFSVNLAEIAQEMDPRTRKMKLEELENKATDDFNKSWTQTISSLKKDMKYSFSIEIDNKEPKRIIFMIKGKDGLQLYLEQKSLGFRWFSAFHLRLRSLMKDEPILGGQSQKGTQIVLLIDEPGQNLHEVAQKDAKKY